MTEQLSGVVQVSRRCPVRSGAGIPQVPCQEWCRYPAGALSGVVQVTRRCPVRSGAGTPQMPCTAVRSGTEIDLLSLRLSVSQGASLGDLLLAPVPRREVKSMSVSFI